MKRQLSLLALILSAFLPSGYLDADAGYRLHPGDRILISVWGEEKLKEETRVLPDGSISFPLAGRTNVKGMSTSQVESAIKGRLTKYIPDAQVTVMVISPDGNRVYVLGKVNKPGPVVMSAPMTVTQALSLAGGLDKFAREEQIKILRLTGEGQIQGFINYNDIASGEDLRTNYELQAGDTIVVP
ncbi:MAG: polysaccharide export protein [Gammaproteobacteria bacterium]|nr:polysaccharide export protein [Gammaproteobacteria bacterium]MBU1654316.1 polysaccharide export protein [Gammaproteobacteria bacterium]MBU1961209.1 polysaccharide export protein [Gammaproteobacteria bacterium]